MRVRYFLLVIVLLLCLVVGVSATGLTKTVDTTTVPGYTIINWTYSASPGTDTWTPPAGVTEVEYLVVAGGGGAGKAYNSAGVGGGGAGGFRSADGYSIDVGSPVNVVVGAGGAKDYNGGISTFDIIESAGGGTGATTVGEYDPGNSGGSGGGGNGNKYSGTSGGSGNVPSITPAQGYNGGHGYGSAASAGRGGGGGGGADGTGANGAYATGGDGGIGKISIITGATVYYAGGGGGGGGGAHGTSGEGLIGQGGNIAEGYIGSNGIVIIKYATPDSTPTANFTATPLIGAPPLPVQFNDTSTATPTSWFWTFGDDTTSILQNPPHTYTATGLYTVSLKATNEHGNDTETKTDYIDVGDPPTAAFTAVPTFGYAPLNVTFTDTSLNNPTEWAWDFDDGNTSILQNPPDNTFANSGIYTVTLTATNVYGYNTTITNITVDTIYPFPGLSNLPTDIDADGIYEDINGNARLDYNDLIIFFQNLAWAKINEPIRAFDLNNNEQIDYNDVILLFNKITGAT